MNLRLAQHLGDFWKTNEEKNVSNFMLKARYNIPVAAMCVVYLSAKRLIVRGKNIAVSNFK